MTSNRHNWQTCVTCRRYQERLHAIDAQRIDAFNAAGNVEAGNRAAAPYDAEHTRLALEAVAHYEAAGSMEVECV